MVFLCLSTLLLVGGAVQQAHGSYPSSYTDMVGLVPRYKQSGDACGLYSPLQVLHWFGLLDVTIEDVADVIGHSEGITYLDQIHDVFEYFMPPGSIHEFGGNDDAEAAKNAVKSYLLWGSPVICCIEAPGHPWWTMGFCNHYLTIVGYDDSLFGGEGGWYVHDTSTWIDPPYYDVPVSYSEFDGWWNHWWTWEPGSNDNRGAVAAILPDRATATEEYAWPFVNIKVEGSTSGRLEVDDVLDSQLPAHLIVTLTNIGTDQSVYQISESQGRDGVTIEIANIDAEITWLDTGGFSSFQGLDTGESGSAGFSGPIQPTRKLELNYDSDTTPGTTISAEIHVQPSSYGGVQINLQGRLTDRNNWQRTRSVWINDDTNRAPRGYGVRTLLPERVCVSLPGSGGFNVIDDDWTPPLFHEQTATPWPVYDNSHDPIVFTLDVTDEESSISKCWIEYYWWPSGSMWERTTLTASAIDTIPGGFTYSVAIPRSEWINHVGESCKVEWYATNGDNDLPGDAETWHENGIGNIVLDDDVDPPVLFNPVSSGDILECDQNDYLLRISAWDSGSGWCSAYFSYRFSGEADWSTGNLGSSGTVPYEYEFHIPRSIWVNHLGEEIYWRVSVIDSDNDRPGDGLWAYSPDYYGGRIIVARTLAQDIRDTVADQTELPNSAFDGATAKVRENRRNSMLNQLDAVLKDITKAEALTDQAARNAAYLSILNNLNSLLDKTDGFAERGAADTKGSGYTPDWIITEEGQAMVDPMIRDLIAIITSRIVI